MRRVLIQNVQAGIFQNVIRLENNRLTYSITEETEYWVREFEKSCTPPLPALYTHSYPLRLFRGLHSLHSFTCPYTLSHPIPFSASLSKQFASEWVYGLPNSIVLEFHVYPTMLHLIVDSDVEREVVVGPGDIHIEHLSYEYDGVKFYTCRLDQYNIMRPQ